MWGSLVSSSPACSLELEEGTLLASDFLCHLSPDNGPCKQVCNLVGDTAMCSCFPGYAIMADGVSCEGGCPGGHLPTCMAQGWGPQNGDRTPSRREVALS